jgi:hypothetical protein
MTLSSAAQEYAFSQFLRDRARIEITHNAKLNDLLPNINRVWRTEQELTSHYVEYVEEIVKARVNSYVSAYRKFNEKLTRGDIKTISLELEKLVSEVSNEISNLPENAKRELDIRKDHLEQQFKRMVPLAEKDLNVAMQELALEQSTNVLSVTIPPPDFSFIRDVSLRTIIERDYTELQRLDTESTPKSVLILAGGIIEGLLIDAIVKSGHWTEQEAFERHLKDMIHPSKTKGIITHDNITDVLRVFRNLVHPAREIRDGLVFSKDHAKHAKTSVDVIISEVREWHSKNP